MDLLTDNFDNLVFSTVQLEPPINDISLLTKDVYPILALRNYLRANKVSILSNTNDLSEIYSIVIQKAMSLSLNPNAIVVDENTLINGTFNLQVNISANTSKQQVLNILAGDNNNA